MAAKNPAAVTLGRLGGQVTSDAKTRAARKNGMLTAGVPRPNAKGKKKPRKEKA